MAFQPANFILGLPGTVFGAIVSVGDVPAITSDGGGATADVSVNTGDTAVTTVTADGTGTEIFSISGGAEALMFTINSGSGALAFTTTSVDGVYEVIVKATNDWGSDTQTITVTVSSGVAYEGPLDIYSTGIVGAFGQRALSADWLGEPLYTLKKMDGGAEPEQVFNADAVTGAAPAAAITTFLDGEAGALVEWNDQSGNGLDSSDPGFPVLWGASIQGGKPGFSGEGVYEPGIQDTPLANGQCTIFAVCNKNCEMNANLSGQGSCYLSTSGNFPEIFMASESDGHQAGGAIDGSGIAAAVHLYEVAWAFGSFSFKVDGVSFPVDDSYDTGGAVASFLTELEARWNSGGILVEWMMFDNIVSAPNRLAISQNIATYYGITI